MRELLLALSVFLSFFGGGVCPAWGQAARQETGDPFIRNYSQREYGAFFQNWCVVQDPRGLIYVGNSSGVLEYDSVRWRLIRTEHRTGVDSLAVDASGRVYVGAQGEFGHLAPSAPRGEMSYVSLLDRVGPADRAFSNIWSIAVLGDRVFFQAYERLFCLRGKNVQVWQPAGAFQIAATVRTRLYVQDLRRGLLTLADDDLVPVAGGERFATGRIRALLPWEVPGAGPDGVLICTQQQGMFVSDGRQVIPFPTQADALLRRAQIHHALLLDDGTLGVATLHGGFVHFSRDGRLLGQLGGREGLANESVKSLFQDSQHGLWLALQKGISRVEISSPVTGFNERRGLPGSVYSICRHQGALYVGTDQGLYRLAPVGPRGPVFSAIRGLKGAVWGFVSWGERLLAANYDGVYEIRGAQAVPVRKSATVSYAILRSRRNPNRLFVGLQNGLAACRVEGGRWIDEGMLVDQVMQVRSLHEADDGSLWVGTFAHGVLRVTFPAGTPRARPRVDRFGAEQGLPSPNHTYVYNLAGGLKVTSHKGIYRFRQDRNRFEPDPAFRGLFSAGERWLYGLEEDRQGRIWTHSCDEDQQINESGSAVPRPDGTYRWDGRSCVRFSGSWVTAILAEDDGVVWFGASDGLMRVDTRVPGPYDRPFQTLIRQVSIGKGRPLFGGTWPGIPAEPRISFGENRIRFEFAALSYDAESGNRHQVLLEGYDADWSAWSPESFKEYTNLSAGRYRFRVRGKNLYGTQGGEGTFVFTVLSPWYRSWWAVCLWILLGVGGGSGIIYLYTLKLRRQKSLLEDLVAKRTRQLREASLTDPLTGLYNRRFIQEVLRNDISAFVGFKNYLLHARNQRLDSQENAVFGVFLLDIDFFKLVNDTYSHDAGDQVLKQFAAILKNSVREDDVVLRWGGEEFLVVLKKTRQDYLPVFAAKILTLVGAAQFDIGDGKTIHKTCSIGYTSFPLYPGQPGLLTFDQILTIADLGLYHAKNTGRNRAIFLDAGGACPIGEAAIRKVATSLEDGLREGYLKIGQVSVGPEPKSG